MIGREEGTINVNSTEHEKNNRKQFYWGLSKKATCLRGRVAEINFGRCLPMSTTLAAATNRGRPP